MVLRRELMWPGLLTLAGTCGFLLSSPPAIFGQNPSPDAEIAALSAPGRLPGSVLESPAYTANRLDASAVGRVSLARTSRNAESSPAAIPDITYEVTTTLDDGDGSLRAALADATAGGGGRVVFNIPGGGLQTIQLVTPLEVSVPVELDGCSQPESDCSVWPPQLAVAISSDPGGFAGTELLWLDASDSVVRGLSFCLNGGGVEGAAVVAIGAAQTFQTSYFGVQPSGASCTAEVGLALGSDGDTLVGSNLDGLDDASEANVFSGSSVALDVDVVGLTQVQGNYFSTSPDGADPLFAANTGIFITGEPELLELKNNTISGNLNGVEVNLTSGTVELTGNRIGVGTSGLSLGITGAGIQTRGTGSVFLGNSSEAFNSIAFCSVGADVQASTRIEHSLFTANDVAISIDGFTQDSGDGDVGVNDGQNYPDIAYARNITGGIELKYRVDTATENASYPIYVEFYRDDTATGQGSTYLGSDTYESGDARAWKSLTLTTSSALSSGVGIVAIATDDRGFSSPFTPASADVDGDGYATGTDCDDSDASLSPGATESVNDGIDQNCDGKELCYKDADNDGYRPDTSSTVSSSDLDCEDSGEALKSDPSGDCNDGSAAINPGATEVVGDSIDQTCDGQEICYKDADGDTYRPDSSSTVTSSDSDCADSGEATSARSTGDCDDSNAAIKPGATELVGDEVDQNCDGKESCYRDTDGDDYRIETVISSTTDTDCQDSGEATASQTSGDCNDSSASIYPGATEVVADGVDQNCDNQEVCYLDKDNDGYRPDSSSTVASTDLDCGDSGEAVSADGTGDCNDSSASIKPGATEIAGDSIDQNCDGQELCYVDADDDGVRLDNVTTITSTDTDCTDAGEALSTDTTGDCNDKDATVKPGSTEVTGDGVDGNCDGKETCYLDADDDGYRPDSSSTKTSADGDCADTGEALSTDGTGDCNDSNKDINPGATEKIGDGIDQTCDGKESCYVDADRDAYRAADGSTVTSSDLDCTDAGEATGALAVDCDDNNSAIRPNATEIADDGVDQNCDTKELCYADQDTDGYRTSTASLTSSDLDCVDSGEATGTVPAGDCNDADADIYPGAVELVGTGIDENCDGVELCYLDADDDGAVTGEGAELESSDSDCSDEQEALANAVSGDCNDEDAESYPGAPEVVGDGRDQSCDGTELCYVDADDDGHRELSEGSVSSENLGCYDAGEATVLDPADDCDDTNPAIYPGAEEGIADGIDSNCDGLETCLADADGDGYGSEAALVESSDFDCTDEGEQTLENAGDCDDASASINPGALELPVSGVDEDCDGEELCFVDVDGDGYRPDDTTTAPSTALQCDVSGVLPADSPSGDCDDQAAAIHPGAEEVAGDELDQDCDGTELCYLDADSDGVRPDELSTVDSTDTDCSDEGEATALVSSGDCDDSSSTINPDATELPGNGVDENCDGIELCYVDQDGDGYLPAEPLTVESSSLGCTDANQGSQSTPMTDCDDESAAIHPEATELPGDTVDQDCDGMELCYVDADGDGHRPESGTVESADLDCSDEGEATVTTSSDDCDDEDPLVYGGADEACDGVDSDCDGSLVDEFDDDDGDGVPGCLGEDSDGDGFRDGEDNCPSVANPEQDDLDGDKAGDLCDSDADGDQVPATSDCNDLDLSVSTLTTVYEDNDGDGFGEADASSQVCGAVPDGYLTVGDDNCPTLSNPDQLDTNEDGEGDACESFALQGNGIACGMVVPTERSKGSWAGAALVLLGFAMGIRRRRARLAD